MTTSDQQRIRLLARTKRLDRTMRAHPYLALLVEGFLLFAVMSFLSTPMAWATDGIEEWNDPGIQSGTEPQGGVHVEQDFGQVKDDVARQTGKSVEELENNINQGVEDAKEQQEAEKEKNEQGKDNKDKDQNKDKGKDTAGSSTNTPNSDTTGTAGTTTNESNGGQGLKNPDALNVSTFMQRLDGVVTHFLMPVAVAWAAWQLVYVALVCGLIGIDPLHVVNSKGDISEVDIGSEVRNRLKNFAYGLAWIAGVWLIFEACVFLVSNLVQILEARL